MRTLLAGARVFEPRSGSLSVADVVIENGRIADVGTGLDGDESVDLSDRVLLPGLFDCHTHVMFSHIDLMRGIQTPFSYRFYEGARNLEATLRAGITTARDAGGADLGVKQAVAELDQAPQHSLTVTGCPGSDTVPCTITRPAVPVQVRSDCEP